MTRRLFLLAAVAVLYAEDFAGKVVVISDGGTIRVMQNGALERTSVTPLGPSPRRPHRGKFGNLSPSEPAYGPAFGLLPSSNKSLPSWVAGSYRHSRAVTHPCFQNDQTVCSRAAAGTGRHGG